VKCIFVNTYYPEFLNSVYSGNRSLEKLDYASQLSLLYGTHFGESDFYSRNLRAAGWEAIDVIANCEPLQKEWGRERGLDGPPLAIAVEQIRRERPDVVYLHDMSIASEAFVQAIRPFGTLIVGQIASPVHPNTCLNGFDLIFTSFPHFASIFRSHGIASFYQPLAFEGKVLEALKERERDLPVTFIGGISPVHRKGTEFLEQLARLTELQVWGYGADILPQDSLLRSRHNGPVWGTEMFNMLFRSEITVNRHIDVAGTNANNMRLFEATGCGALLITDFKDNLQDLFEVGKEVVAYRTPQECAELIHYYQRNREEARAIARAGQARTLREHSYANRMKQTAMVLQRAVRRKLQPAQPVDISRVSFGHSPLDSRNITDLQKDAWKEASVAQSQRRLVESELPAAFRGAPPRVFTALVDSLEPITNQGDSILEIGCASGYASEVLEYLLHRSIQYTGIDYSEAMISMAREYYPEKLFLVADATAVPLSANLFNVTISSCVLLHLSDPEAGVREAIRLSNKYIIAHRTPVCRKRPTHTVKKFGYEVEMFEHTFNEVDFISMFSRNGAVLVRVITLSEDPVRDEYNYNYIFKKIIDSI
jgi:ubiquinone/menaquinone biosynthesis C-methylase UbiE